MGPADPATRPRTADATRAFFESLRRRGHEPLLERASGTLRFDLVDGGRVQHWHVTVSKGDVAVSHERAPADASVRVDKGFFDDLVAGRANATAAVLRGALVPEGDIGLLLLFQRIFGEPRPDGEEGGS